MHRRADGRHEYFRAQGRIVVVDFDDVRDQLHAVHRDIVETADERRDERSPRLRGKQRLIGGETQRHVDHSAFFRQRLAGLQAVPGQRHFHRDIFVYLCELASFGHHLVIGRRGDFGTDGPVDDFANLFYNLDEISSAFCDERRICRHAVNETGIGQVANGIHICGIHEKFHCVFPTLQG